MPELSERQRRELEQSKRLLTANEKNITSIIEQYSLANGYEGLLALIARQKSVIDNVMAGKEIGYSVEELSLPINEYISIPHLANVAHIAKQAKGLSGKEEQQQYIDRAGSDLHVIKNQALAARHFTSDHDFLFGTATRSR